MRHLTVSDCFLACMDIAPLSAQWSIAEQMTNLSHTNDQDYGVSHRSFHLQLLSRMHEY